MFYYVLHILIQKPGFCSEKKINSDKNIEISNIFSKVIKKICNEKSIQRIYYKPEFMKT